MLTDRQIRTLVRSGEVEIENMDDLEEQLQPSGIDLRIGSDYLEDGVDNPHDAKNDISQMVRFQPKTFHNIHTIEKVVIPDDIVGFVDGRSTLERAGLGIRASGSIDPGYEGVLEFGAYNYTNEVISVKVGYPIVQLSFSRLDEPVETAYGDQEDSKYQGQETIVGPRGMEKR